MKTMLSRRTFARVTLAASMSVAGLKASAVIAGARAKVVVVGGGAGGASVAGSLARSGENIDVTLINERASHPTCYFSNLAIGGLRSFESITQDYEGFKNARPVDLVIDRATVIDPTARTVTVAGGARFDYDRLIVSPGIDFRYDGIEGYSEAAGEVMPHAWRSDGQAARLRRQLADMEDGGTFVICPPAEPYRCPPGPYERASLAAHYLKTEKPRSKIVIIDAKNKYAKQALFEEGWARFYPGLIEWLPEEFTGGVTTVDPKNMTVSTEDETFKASVANIIPPQTCGRIALDADLADETGWCPVEPATLASRRHRDIHVLGDAIIAGDMPKSAFAANSQAKLCAHAILAELFDVKAPEPALLNTCWSLIAKGHAVKVGASYRAAAEKFAKTESFVSQLDESDERRAETAEEAKAWYDGFTREIFG
jgi:NADPH-dependent 2,4-dienoyl-CoA reductase/sulfur reductase-like enzyme